MKLLILGTVICLMGAFASTDTGITSKRDPRFFFRLRNALNPDDKNALIRLLRNEVSVLRALITALQPLIATNARRCPAGVNARRIEETCYSVTSGAVTHAEAQLACLNNGGWLAEPPLTTNGLADFAADINTVFPGVATAHIGFVETATNGDIFLYPHNGIRFLRADVPAVFPLPASDAVTNIESALLAIPAGTLTVAIETDDAASIILYK